MSFQSSDSQLVLLHHLESLVDGGELTLEHELWTAGERQGLLPVGLRELYPKRFAVIFSFFQEAVRHVVMMNIDGANSHDGTDPFFRVVGGAIGPHPSLRERVKSEGC